MEQIRQQGGEVYAITSEPQTLATTAQEEWATDMIHVGDPHQEIAADCQARGWLSLFTKQWTGNFMTVEWASHPKGYYQPGVLAVSAEQQILYRWRSRPNRQNIGGAIARPTPNHVWQQVQENSSRSDSADYDSTPELDAKPAPWPLFVMLLLSNGWFVKARPFDFRPGEDSVRSRQRAAMLRLPLFGLLWIALFSLAPLILAAALLLVWIAIATPAVREIYANFQDVAADAEP